MAYSILSEAARQHLEQERVRLLRDRDAIIASITADLDRLIQQLDGLLGEATLASSPSTPVAIQSEVPETVEEVTPLPEVASPRSQRQAKPKAKAKARRVQSFDAKQFKRSFQGMTASDAIVQVMAQVPDQPLEPNALIEALYEPFAESDWGRARKSVSAVLLHGIRSGKFEKVQENPAQYQLKDPAAISG
jgi:hypothetical protein